MASALEVLRDLADIVGQENVLTAPSQLACYAADFYPGDGHLPQVVVLPRYREEVSAVLRLASRYGLAVLPRGSGTSVTGGAVPVRGGLVLDLSRLNRVLCVDPDNLYAVVEPGVVWAELNKVLAAYNLFSPSTPGSGRVSTVGGSLACGGSGMRSLKYGTIREQVLGLTVVLPNGEELRLGGITAKTACGYDLKDLFIGAEGTLGVITEIIIKLWPRPPASLLAEVALEEPAVATAILAGLRREGVLPSAFELVPAATLRLVGAAGASERDLLLAEFQGPAVEVAYAEERLLALARGGSCRFWRTGPEQAARWRWFSEIYFRLVRLKTSPIAEDVGVPVGKVPQALKLIQDLFARHGLAAGLMSHAGDGTIHCVLAVDGNSPEEWARAQAARQELYELVLRLGGTITAEHGLGLYRAPYAARQLGPALALMRQIKQVLDPANLLNPGKLGLEGEEV